MNCHHGVVISVIQISVSKKNKINYVKVCNLSNGQGGTCVKKDSSTESWGKIEMTDEWIQLAQTNPHRIHFIMPFTFKQS